MNIVFRADASLQMGTGHIMRCLTLAEMLKKQGNECYFICRNHTGNLVDKIRNSGFYVYTIGSNDGGSSSNQLLVDNQIESGDIKSLFHAAWLGVTQQQDAKDCVSILEVIQPDWLIVDHYALDKTWQQLLKPNYKKLMVIDDLGDREHLADLLLDQNYGSTFEKYKDLVPENCEVLTGTKFALLRPEFAKWRDYSLKRRKDERGAKHILITLGGVDPDNYTGKILEQLAKTKLSSQVIITVVMGATAPHLQSVQQQADIMPVKTTVAVNVSNMAELMSNADLAIGAAGATTWERCCLGLPTIQVVIAENQREAAEALKKINLIKLLSNLKDISALLADTNNWLQAIAKNREVLVDGKGTDRVVVHLNDII